MALTKDIALDFNWIANKGSSIYYIPTAYFHYSFLCTDFTVLLAALLLFVSTLLSVQIIAQILKKLHEV